MHAIIWTLGLMAICWFSPVEHIPNSMVLFWIFGVIYAIGMDLRKKG